MNSISVIVTLLMTGITRGTMILRISGCAGGGAYVDQTSVPYLGRKVRYARASENSQNWVGKGRLKKEVLIVLKWIGVPASVTAGSGSMS
jgi:hypothetical protein